MFGNKPWEEPLPKAKASAYETGKREWILALVLLASALAACNFTLYGGFNLGFAIRRFRLHPLRLFLSAGFRLHPLGV